MILSSLMMLSMVFVMITLAGESAKRIVEVNEKSTLTNPEKPIYSIKDGSVSFENVALSIPQKLKWFWKI